MSEYHEQKQTSTYWAKSRNVFIERKVDMYLWSMYLWKKKRHIFMEPKEDMCLWSERIMYNEAETKI